MDRLPLKSRAIVSAGYDPESQTLELEFASGRIYRYADVPRGTYEWLLRAPNKGGYVARMINGRYAHSDVSEPAVEPVGDLSAALRDSLRDVARKPSDREPS